MDRRWLVLLMLVFDQELLIDGGEPAEFLFEVVERKGIIRPIVLIVVGWRGRGRAQRVDAIDGCHLSSPFGSVLADRRRVGSEAALRVLTTNIARKSSTSGN